jgi:hypothetical protein
MSDLCRLIWCALIGPFRPRAAVEAENLVLRHQLNVLRRKAPKRLAFGNVDRLVFTALYRVAPGVLDALKILKPQTVIRWHRAGFRAYWRWKSRGRGGRPKTAADIRRPVWPWSGDSIAWPGHYSQPGASETF